MAAKVLVQARIDSDVKKEAARVLDAIGLTLSDAVRLMLVRVAAEKQLPFEMFRPNAETLAAIEEAQNGNLSSANSIEELFDQLNAED